VAAHGAELRDGEITYRAEREEWIRATAPHIRAARERLFFYFGPVADSGITVHIAADRDEFLALTGPAFPDWGVAAAVPRLGRIVLMAPGAGTWPMPYAQVVQHEYAHIYLHRLAGPDARIPRWLDEGFAMHTAFEWGIGRYMRLARAAWAGQLLNLRELEGVNRFGSEKAALAYTQSFAAYQFLEDQFGREGVRELLRALGRGLSIDQAFHRALGSGYPDFQASLVIELEKRYSIMTLITDAGFWWALLALLIVVVWLLKKRRAREIERRWRIEDRIQGEPNFNEYVDPDDDESWRG